MERLQKTLAAHGIGSRRKCEEYILEGRVTVNGKIVRELGTKVTAKDEILFDGKKILIEDKVYYLLNKPAGYISTVKDELDRKTILDLFAPAHLKKRIYPVGRLDIDTTGVILLTNDGELSNILIHPKNEIEKEYQVRVEGLISETALRKLTKGIMLDGVMTKPCTAYLISKDTENHSSLIRIVLTEGRNHQVKDMMNFIGHPVKKLNRIKFAGIEAKDLARGLYRELKIHEVKTLYALAKSRKKTENT
ncbi:MAG: rRNA pseudouridine synthase [Erysipelotrichales bacterium]|nr:rRNA pseudouridine synthase [Erysipelotrichales bacterium]